MAVDTAKSLGEGLGIAMLAAWADFRASTQRIPRRIGPLDFGVIAHDKAPPNGVLGRKTAAVSVSAVR